MKITPLLIQKLAQWLIGGPVFAAMKNIVGELENTTLSGAQKREAALKQFSIIGYSLAGWAVNLALELAVAWIRKKSDA